MLESLFPKKIPVLLFKESGGILVIEENSIAVTRDGYKIKIDGEVRYVDPKMIVKRVYYKNKPYALLFYDKTRTIRGVEDIEKISEKDIKTKDGEPDPSIFLPKLKVIDTVSLEWFVMEHLKKEREWKRKKEIFERITQPLMLVIIIFSMIIVGYLMMDMTGKLVKISENQLKAISVLKEIEKNQTQILKEVGGIIKKVKGNESKVRPPI